MRQAGIIAASGIVALDQSIEQLKIDHSNAQYLAEEINKINYLNIEIDRIKTNILYKANSPNDYPSYNVILIGLKIFPYSSFFFILTLQAKK